MGSCFLLKQSLGPFSSVLSSLHWKAVAFHQESSFAGDLCRVSALPKSYSFIPASHSSAQAPHKEKGMQIIRTYPQKGEKKSLAPWKVDSETSPIATPMKGYAGLQPHFPEIKHLFLK